MTLGEYHGVFTAYWILNGLTSIILVFSYIKDDLFVVRICVMLSTVRGTLRLYDLENTNFNYSDTKQHLILSWSVFSLIYCCIFYLGYCRLTIQCIIVTHILTAFQAGGLALCIRAWDFQHRMEILAYIFCVALIFCLEIACSKYLK